VEVEVGPVKYGFGVEELLLCGDALNNGDGCLGGIEFEGGDTDKRARSRGRVVGREVFPFLGMRIEGRGPELGGGTCGLGLEAPPDIRIPGNLV